MSLKKRRDDISEIWSILKEITRKNREIVEDRKETERLLKEYSKEYSKEKAKYQKESAKYQREIAQNRKETERFLKEQAKEVKELEKLTNQRIKELNELFTGQWGKLIEVLVEGDLIRLLKERQIKVKRTVTRAQGVFRGEMREMDILAFNGSEMVVVEVKTTLKVKDVRYFVEKLKTFLNFFPEYKGKVIYGAMAYLKANEASNELAKKQGLFVIRAVGSSASIVNAKNFKPRKF